MGLGSNNSGSKATYLSIIGGKIKEQSSEGSPGAEQRKWETKDGKSGTKWEISHDFIEGLISGLDFYDGEFGTSLNVSIVANNKFYKLQISTKSRYYDDFAKKVKALDLTKEVKLTPFDFEAEDKKNGGMKKIVGISVSQQGEKIISHYYDGKKSINNMPKVDEKEKEELGKAYWTVYFTKVGVFLRKEIESIDVPKVVIEDAAPTILSQETEHAKGVDEDDLPF